MSYSGDQGDTSFNNNQNSDSQDGFSWDTSPFRWVLVPICILIVAGFITFFLRYRKRHKQRGSQGMNALERDLEAMGPNRARRTGDTRWQWVGNGQRTGRRVGLGVGSREEGLNEFGEAPPAYAPPVKDTADVELHDLPPSPVHTHSNATVPCDTGSPSTHDATLPAYGEAPPRPHSSARISTSTMPTQLSVPAPAVLTSR